MVVNEFINYWFGKVAKTKQALQRLMQRTVYSSIRIYFPLYPPAVPFLLSSKRVIKSIIVAINIKFLFSLSFLTVKLLRTVNGFVIDSRPVKENTFHEGGPWGAIAHPTNNPSSVEFVPRAFSLISHVPSDGGEDFEPFALRCYEPSRSPLRTVYKKETLVTWRGHDRDCHNIASSW